MVNVGDDGILFKENAGSAFKRYLCNPETGSWDAEGVSITSVDMNGFTCGLSSTAFLTAMTLL